MERVTTYAPLDEVESDDLNDWQDFTQGSLGASDNSDIADTKGLGSDTRYAQVTGSVADATAVLLDDSTDWRDRWVEGVCAQVGANDRMGQSTDYNLNTPTVTSVARCTFGPSYTGRGAYSNLTTGAAVSNGNPPLNGAGVYRSEAPVVDDFNAGSVFVYAHPSTGALYLYNNAGGALYLIVRVTGTGSTGLRP